ncbi:hypothetical protein BD311DRAFT_744081 [Dichomitus squalens]|uniref:Uncharacterized protein n=1 Tax=Dichomitus squalens TaxID=114155 RepID=A0A4Q9N8B3_9APHY|nr:hypothetical protein BD311DRAFT_744081 [Dichomitus squalens]
MALLSTASMLVGMLTYRGPPSPHEYTSSVPSTFSADSRPRPSPRHNNLLRLRGPPRCSGHRIVGRKHIEDDAASYLPRVAGCSRSPRWHRRMCGIAEV